MKEKIQGQKVFNTEQDAISLSLLDFTVHDNERAQIFIMACGDYFLLDVFFSFESIPTREIAHVAKQRRRNSTSWALLSTPDGQVLCLRTTEIFAVFFQINWNWLFFW